MGQGHREVGSTPRSSEREKLLESIAWSLGESPGNDLIFLAYYGSRRPDSDLDLLAVFEQVAVMSQVLFGNVDLLQLSREEFMDLLDRRDICATEPLLSGRLLVGDAKDWSRLEERIRSETVPAGVPSYLLECSRNALGNATSFYQLACDSISRRNQAGFWANCSFAVGYLEYAAHYSNGGRVLTCAELAEASDALAEVLAEVRLSRGGAEKAGLGRMKAWLERTHRRIQIVSASIK